MAMQKTDGLLTAGKIAKELGIAPVAVKKVIEEQNIVPDATRCGCSYYGPEALRLIKDAVKK